MTENYSCYIDYDNEKKRYFGEVRGRYDGALFYGHTLEALKASFADSVRQITQRDDYTDACADNVVSIAHFHANSVDALTDLFQSSIPNQGH